MAVIWWEAKNIKLVKVLLALAFSAKSNKVFAWNQSIWQLLAQFVTLVKNVRRCSVPWGRGWLEDIDIFQVEYAYSLTITNAYMWCFRYHCLKWLKPPVPPKHALALPDMTALTRQTATWIGTTPPDRKRSPRWLEFLPRLPGPLQAVYCLSGLDT